MTTKYICNLSKVKKWIKDGFIVRMYDDKIAKDNEFILEKVVPAYNLTYKLQQLIVDESLNARWYEKEFNLSTLCGRTIDNIIIYTSTRNPRLYLMPRFKDGSSPIMQIPDDTLYGLIKKLIKQKLIIEDKTDEN